MEEKQRTEETTLPDENKNPQQEIMALETIPILDLSPGTQVGIIAGFLTIPVLGIGAAILGLGEAGFFVAVVGATAVGLGGKFALDKGYIGNFSLGDLDWSALLGTVDTAPVVEGTLVSASGTLEHQDAMQENHSAANQRTSTGRPQGNGEPVFPPYPKDETLFLGALADTGQRVDPSINCLLGMGLLVAGSPGAGKSNLAAVLFEQAGKCLMAEIIFDLKGEYHTIVPLFPNGIRAGHPDFASKAGPGFYPLTSENASDFARDVMEYGFQVVIDLPSYKGDFDESAQIMAAIFNGVMDWSEDQPHDERHNCLIGIDEAHNFFPQQATLSGLKIKFEHVETLQKGLSRVANMGRSYGITLALLTQRLPHIAKSAIANLQIKVMMRHTLDLDLKRCEEEVGSDVAKRQTIKTLSKGDGIVIGLLEDPLIVHFDERQSEHESHTPDISRSHKRFKNGYKRLSRVLAQRIPGTPQEQAVAEQFEDPQVPQREVHTDELDERQLRLLRPVFPSHSAEKDPPVPRKYEKALVAYNNGNTSSRRLAQALSTPENPVSKDKAWRAIQEMKKLGLIQEVAEM